MHPAHIQPHPSCCYFVTLCVINVTTMTTITSMYLFLRLHLQLLFQFSPINVPFCSAVYYVFLDVGTFPAKSGRSRWDVYPNQIQVRSNMLKIDENWIFFWLTWEAILQIQNSPTLDTNHFAEKKSTTNATHHACQDGSFWKVTGTYEVHCLPQGAKHEKTFSHWVISDYDQGVNTKLESDLELVYAKKKSVSSLTVSFFVGSRKWGIEMFAWRKCILVFGYLSFKESM